MEVIDLAAGCCGMAGTFGMKKGTYDLSMQTGAPLFERIAAVEPDLVASECSTCRLQIAEATSVAGRAPGNTAGCSIRGVDISCLSDRRVGSPAGSGRRPETRPLLVGEELPALGPVLARIVLDDHVHLVFRRSGVLRRPPR